MYFDLHIINRHAQDIELLVADTSTNLNIFLRYVPIHLLTISSKWYFTLMTLFPVF